MKKQFLHETHNRQDKAKKPDYRQDMQPKAEQSWSGVRPHDSDSGKYEVTIGFPFNELHPVAIEALTVFDPRLDINRLIQSLEAESGRYKAVFRRDSMKVPQARIVFEQRKLVVQLSKTQSIAGRFLYWNYTLSNRKPVKRPQVPKQFNTWLSKFAAKSLPKIPSTSAVQQHASS